ncbi:putative nuclease harbi1 [Nowakowskiella sp. JEL0078]|nr:putative nuclease harbi1 [Nowakowskiella sp. JEL0078]
MSKSTADCALWDVVEVINTVLHPQIAHYPTNPNSKEWKYLSTNFENISRFPNACLAVDGTLIEIERPNDFEGWYCCKGYPAVNVQIVIIRKSWSASQMGKMHYNAKKRYDKMDFMGTPAMH